MIATRWMPDSLRGRLVALVLLSFIPATLLVAYSAWQYDRQLRTTQHDEALHLAHLAAAGQRAAFDDLRHTLIGLGAFLDGVPLHRGTCEASFAHVRRAYPGLAALAVFDLKGNVVCSDPPARGRVNVADRPYFTGAIRTRGFALGDYQIGRITGKATINGAYPLFDRNRRLRGIIMGALELQWITRVAAVAVLPPRSTLTMIDRRGVVLVRFPEQEWIGRQVGDTALVKTILHDHHGVTDQVGLDGRPRVMGFAPVNEGAGIYLIVGLDRSLPVRIQRLILGRNLGLLAGLWLIMLAMIWIGGRRFVIRPIHDLDEAAARIAAGDFTAAGALTTAPGELGRLARTFNAMAGALSRREADLRDAQTRLSDILNIAADGIIVVDSAQRVILFNKGAETIFGYRAQEVLGQPLNLLVPTRHHTQHIDDARAFARSDDGARRMGEHRDVTGRRKDGSEFPAEVSIAKSEHKGETVLTAIVRDITERKRNERDIVYLAHHDALTGLPNRTLFRTQLEQAILAAQAHQRLVALVFLDLDRFKIINDTLGHATGDELLVQVAVRLKDCVRGGDTVARLGGDEFTLIFADMAHVDDVAHLCQKVLDAFKPPFHVHGQELFVNASLGVTVSPFDDSNVDQLLKNADAAMYHAKSLGGARAQFYSDDMNTRVAGRLSLETALRRAIDNREMNVEYQPQVDADSGHVVGIEALLRWQHGDRLISPSEFIPIAEESGMIHTLGDWVLDAACAQAKRWHLEGTTRPIIAVNVSARQFEQADFLERVRNVLERHALEPRFLELEFTETTLMQSTEATFQKLVALRALGVRLAMDDFGTGYSSLNYLKRFPINTLKIDRTFVVDAPTDTGDAAIAHAVIDLARALGITPLAEGVETAEQARFLLAQGCSLMQGYLFSKPVPADRIPPLLTQRFRIPA